MSSNEPVIFGGEDDGAFEYVILGVPRDGEAHQGERLSFTRRQYHLLAATDTGWREADTATDEFGSTVFQAAGVLDDGTLIGRVESRGASRRDGSLRVAVDGRWSSVIESGPVRTEAHGRLRAPDDPIKLRRTKSRANKLLWTADAITEFDVVADDGTPVARRTTGKITYPGGGTGTFRTDYLSASSDGRFRQSSGTWQPVPGLGPGQTGSQTTKKLPGGPGNVEWERRIIDLNTHDSQVDSRVERQGKQADGTFHHTITQKQTVTSGGRTTETTTVDHTWGDDRGTHWERTTTSTGGRETVERGEVVINGSTASVSTSSASSDGSTRVETTTSDMNTGLGQRHTVVTNSSGQVKVDETVAGKGDHTNWRERPGDVGKFFEPTPSSSSGSEQQAKDKKEDNDSSDDTDGDDNSGDDTDGDDSSGEEDPEPDGGGDETETPDDGFGEDDTGGYPGLGWDGGSNGPLELLPAAARAAMGRFDDPNHPIDSLGDDSGLTALLAQAFAEAARRGGSDVGHGQDTGEDPLHGVSAETLAKAARDAPPVDPEWGDWSNPKAHARFIDRVVVNVATEIGRAATDLHHVTQIEVATSLQKFL